METATQQQLSNRNQTRYVGLYSLDVAHAHTCTHRDVITLVIGQSWTKCAPLFTVAQKGHTCKLKNVAAN